jgi:hypothetical protein
MTNLRKSTLFKNVDLIVSEQSEQSRRKRNRKRNWSRKKRRRSLPLISGRNLRPRSHRERQEDLLREQQRRTRPKRSRISSSRRKRTPSVSLSWPMEGLGIIIRLSWNPLPGWSLTFGKSMRGSTGNVLNSRILISKRSVLDSVRTSSGWSLIA